MSKKTLCGIAVCIVLLLCLILYFRPLPLSDNVSDRSSFIVQITHFDVQDGEPRLNSNCYDDITREQKRKILDLTQKYSYQRTPSTIFSDGTIRSVGNMTVLIYVSSGESTGNSIYVSDSGQIFIDSKLYKMKNASQFNQQLEDILKE